MFSWFIEQKLRRFEQTYDYDMSYVREMLRLSPRAYLLFSRATSLSSFRRGVSLEAWHAASLVAIVAEDCGPCTQISVTMAERAGVDPRIIANLIAGRFEALPDAVAETARFTLATLRRSPEANELRERIERRAGRVGLLSIAFAITTARIYPTVKYALGYGHACQRVTVGGHAVVPDDAIKLHATLADNSLHAGAA
ncbi:MAG: hypothetical protein QM784_05395 [Polyangiaceae bacterium]